MEFKIKYFIVMIFVFFLRDTAAELKLKFLTVLFRHGDRTPLSTGNEQFPTNPYHNSTFEPFGIGQLTDNGRQRSRNLGVYIRKKYNKFLGNSSSSEELLARSTNRERAIITLELVLSGIYPDSKQDSFEIIYPKRVQDVLLTPHDCPKFLEELHRVENTPEFKAELSKYTDLLEKLSNWTGKQLTQAKELSGIFNYLTGLKAAGYVLPEWASEIYPGEQLLNGTIFHFQSYSYTPRLKTLNAGIFLKNLTGVMSSIVNKQSHLKMALYSSHDYNIVGFLEALGVFKPHFPGYSNAIFIELLTNDYDKYYIKIYYYLGTSQETQELEIPKCDNPCPFDNFVELYKNIFPTEEDMECYRLKSWISCGCGYEIDNSGIYENSIIHWDSPRS